MKMIAKRYMLSFITGSVLVAFVSSILLDSFLIMLIMLALMIIMVTLQIWNIRKSIKEARSGQKVAPEVKRKAILILGPYAEKWFKETDTQDSAFFSDQATCILISDPYALTRRLRDIHHHAPGTSVITFFPFLPDGHATSVIIGDTLRHWVREFSGITAHLRLPCIFGIYARLSTEPRSNVSQNATWLSTENLNTNQELTYASLIQRLNHHLDKKQHLTSHDLQRAMMGDELICWLEECGLAEIISSIFNAPPLALTNIMLCDYGDGFTRHGAWSRWLESKYGVLPGLGKSILQPPIPTLTSLKHDDCGTINTVSSLTKKPPMLWSVALIVLLLSLHILNTGWQIAQQKQMFNLQIMQLDMVKGLSLNILNQRIQAVERDKKEWEKCLSIPALRYWGLSPCQSFVNQLEQQIAVLKATPTLSTGSAIAMFDSGSSDLLPSALTMLKEIESLIHAYPNYKIHIVGHSDNTGSSERNLALSAQRAESISNWLINRGINSSRLEIHAFGASEPVASNKTVEGRKQNRRVEIIALPTSVKRSNEIQ
ncbi:OmpA family protein [Enterobacter ludwigii]|nr:OmpA family protein [Enterobacter ludwigii]